ncbi:site-2 protease family protein [candidate division KSB1 bacterium]|nr:site-2 protease family protein [candidate division KSB1 bacterium]
MNILSLLLLAPPILLALTVHEFAHAFVAHRLGDDTAKQHGRLTLNPLAHLDLIGTIMLFLVHIGWAKPVPVNPYNLRDPKKDMLWISAAGPLSNMIMAFIFGIMIRITMSLGVTTASPPLLSFFLIMLFFGLQINLALAIFNILPIPPLDGSKILYGVLPKKYEHIMVPLQKYGMFILIGLILIGRFGGVSILGQLIWPFVKFFSIIFAGFYPGF